MFQDRTKNKQEFVYFLVPFVLGVLFGILDRWGVHCALLVAVGVMVMVKLQGNTVNGATLRSPL